MMSGSCSHYVNNMRRRCQRNDDKMLIRFSKNITALFHDFCAIFCAFLLMRDITFPFFVKCLRFNNFELIIPKING